jgi:hypothetical protein
MQIPVVSNVHAALVHSPKGARDALAHPVTAVQWAKSMRILIGCGVATFLEVGAGKVLCGLMRQIDPSTMCLKLEDEASLPAAVSYSGMQRQPPPSAARYRLHSAVVPDRCGLIRPQAGAVRLCCQVCGCASSTQKGAPSGRSGC